MKKSLIALFILLGFASAALAQPSFEEKMAVKETVAKWNSAMHISTINQLNNLYASSLFYYGKHRLREVVVREKSQAVNEFAGFHQEITTPIQITSYKTGTVKCSFTKRIRHKQTVEESQCYLLLQKKDDRYQITGEGDHQTEGSLNAVLNLGDEVLPETAKSDTYWVIFCAASLILLIGIIWMMGKSRMVSQSFVHPKTNAHSVQIIPAEQALELAKAKEESMKNEAAKKLEPVSTISNPKAAKADQQDDSRVFEEYIANRFPKDQFNIIEWRADKNKGRNPEVTSLPDLQLEFQAEKFPFAVECKWRNDFWKGIIEWARDSQISSYQEFQTSKEMPVFVALGVGGTPSEPRDLFIIPLSHLYKSILTEEWLKKYKRESRGHFCLHLDPISLK